MNGRDTRGGALPLLPSGPGGVHVPTLSRPHASTSTERERFELSIPFRIYTRSRRAPSAARPPLHLCRSGERRIRTYGTVAGTPDFESGAFDLSASSPSYSVVLCCSRKRRKNSLRIRAHSSPSTPSVIRTRWLCRGSSRRL